MRKSVCLVVFLALSTSGLVRAEKPAELQAVLDKAIKALGGEEKLAKFKADSFKGKGKFYGMGEGIDYTGEWDLQQPNKLRVRIEVVAGDMKFVSIRVVNGDKVWSKLGDQTQEVKGEEEIVEAREASFTAWVATLLPLKDKEFKLSPLAEVKVDGKPAVGIQVAHKGYREVGLFFDKETGLLVRTTTQVKDLMNGGKEVTQEALYSDHKPANGVLRPRKVVINRDDKKFIDVEVTEIEPKEKLDDALFGKP